MDNKKLEDFIICQMTSDGKKSNGILCKLNGNFLLSLPNG